MDDKAAIALSRDAVVVTDETIVRIADVIVDVIADRVSRIQNREWLDSQSASQYLGVSRKALYLYVEKKHLPVHQDEPGAKLWFKRSELDAWRVR